MDFLFDFYSILLGCALLVLHKGLAGFFACPVCREKLG